MKPFLKLSVRVGAFLAAFLVFGATAVVANASAPDEGEAIIVGASLSSMASTVAYEDAVLLSADLGLTVRETQDYFRGEQEFLRVLSDVIESDASRYAASAWAPAEERSAWVSFTGEVDDRLVALFETLPIRVEVRFGARLSAAAIEVSRQSIMSELMATGIVEQLMSTVDPISGSVDVAYELKAGNASAAPLLRAADDLRSAHDDIRVSLRESPRPIMNSPEIVRGGTAVYKCTAGFNIRILGTPAYKGILSAAHCNNAAGIPAGSTYGTVHRGQHAGAYGEVQKHSSSDPLIGNTIIIAPSTYRLITSVTYPTVGSSVCNYGKTRTAHSCTTVRATGLSFYADIDGVNTYISRMVQSNGTFTNMGDSGGPWFNGNSAVGIHYVKSGGYSTFSQVGFAQSVLAVSVITN